MLTVKQVIEILQSMPQDLLVFYPSCSEACLLEAADVALDWAQPPRPDGWVGDPRKDKPMQQYLKIGR